MRSTFHNEALPKIEKSTNVLRNNQQPHSRSQANLAAASPGEYLLKQRERHAKELEVQLMMNRIALLETEKQRLNKRVH